MFSLISTDNAEGGTVVWGRMEIKGRGLHLAVEDITKVFILALLIEDEKDSRARRTCCNG